MRIKRLSGALVISVVCHFIIAIIVGLHSVTQNQQFKDLIGCEVLQPKEPPNPKVRKPIVKPVIPQPVPEFSNPTVKAGNSLNTPITAEEVLQAQGLNPPNGAPFDDVFFKDPGTNPFIDTEDDKFSTFGMDVDTASYSVMRRTSEMATFRHQKPYALKNLSMPLITITHLHPTRHSLSILRARLQNLAKANVSTCCASAFKAALFQTMPGSMRYSPL